MSQYIGFSLDLRSPASWLATLALSFESKFFSPIALVGWTEHSDGSHWFLSGYDVSDAVLARAWRGGMRPAKVVMGTTLHEGEQEYLAAIANTLLTASRDEFEVGWSPFHKFDEHSLVGFVPDVRLDSRVCGEYWDWVREERTTSATLYGTVDLTADDVSERPWNCSFEFAALASDGRVVMGGPFLQVSISTHEEGGDRSRLTVYARSSIWLNRPDKVKSPHTLAGRMSSGLADEFLARLVGFCGCLGAVGPQNVEFASLDIGDAFVRYDGDRIRGAFQAGLKHLDLNWQ
jgi:hypothetical protein